MEAATPPVDGPTESSLSLKLTAEVLWEACRRHPRPDRIRDAIERGADLNAATTAAIAHRIAPLLWRALSLADSLDALGQSRTPLGDVFEVFRMEALLLLPRAVALAVRPLSDAGLEPVVLKGPAVASRYPEPGLRPMEDIDLLLPGPQHNDALAALGAAGWVVIRSARRDTYDTVLTHVDVPSLSLELHYGLEYASQRVTTLNSTALWNSRQPIDCLGTPAFGLPLSEEIVYLAAHAGKPHHGFFRLIWVADFAMIVASRIESGGEVEWTGVAAAAAEGSCTTVVSAALALARRTGVNAPEDLFQLPTRGWRGTALRQLTDVSWPLAHLELPGYHLNYALADTRRRRLRILLVLLGSGYGIGKAMRRIVAAPGTLVARTRKRRTTAPIR